MAPPIKNRPLQLRPLSGLTLPETLPLKPIPNLKTGEVLSDGESDILAGGDMGDILTGHDAEVITSGAEEDIAIGDHFAPPKDLPAILLERFVADCMAVFESLPVIPQLWMTGAKKGGKAPPAGHLSDMPSAAIPPPPIKGKKEAEMSLSPLDKTRKTKVGKASRRLIADIESHQKVIAAIVGRLIQYAPSPSTKKGRKERDDVLKHLISVSSASFEEISLKIYEMQTAAYRRVKKIGRIDSRGYDLIVLPVIEAVKKAHDFFMVLWHVFDQLGISDEKAGNIRTKIHNFNNYPTALISYNELWRTAVEMGDQPDFSDLQPPGDIGSAIKAAVKWNEHIAHQEGTGVRFSLIMDIPQEIAMVRIDRPVLIMLQDIFDNFISNARKYYSKLRPMDERRVTVRVTANHTKGVLYFEIVDNGRGMSEETLKMAQGNSPYRDPKVVEENIPGTGYGFGSALSTISRIGGMVAIESVENAGTGIYGILPLASLFPSSKKNGNGNGIGIGHRIGNRIEDFRPEGVIAQLLRLKMDKNDIELQRDRLSQLTPRENNELVHELSASASGKKLDTGRINDLLKRVGLRILNTAENSYIITSLDRIPIAFPQEIRFADDEERRSIEDIIIKNIRSSPESLNNSIHFWKRIGIDHLQEVVIHILIRLLKPYHEGGSRHGDLAILSAFIKRQGVFSPLSIERVRRSVPHSYQEDFASLVDIDPFGRAEEIAFAATPEVDWKKIERLKPAFTRMPSTGELTEIVIFVEAIQDALDPYIMKKEALSIVAHIGYTPEKWEQLENAEQALSSLRGQIAVRYRGVYEQIMSLEGTHAGDQLELRHPFLFEELRSIFISAEMRGDPNMPSAYREILTASRMAEAAFEAAAKKFGLPSPWRLAAIAERYDREAEYRRIAGPLSAAFKKVIIPIMATLNEALVPFIHQNVFDYVFNRIFGFAAGSNINWDRALQIASRMKKETQEENGEFIRSAAELMGIPPGEVRPWDIEYAFKALVAREAGITGRPKIPLKEAMKMVREFCLHRFGIDLEEKSLGIIWRLNQSEIGRQIPRGITFSGTDGLKAVLIPFGSEELAIDDLKTLLHETGHLIHDILAERNLSAKGVQHQTLTSIHSSILSEAFAMVMEEHAYEILSVYKPAGFTGKYLAAHMQLSGLYETFRIRRTAMWAQAARLIASPDIPSIEAKRRRILELQGEWLGITGDKDYAFIYPPLASPRQGAYLMTYVLARALAGNILKKAEEDKVSPLNIFVPLLKMGDALTQSEMNLFLNP